MPCSSSDRYSLLELGKEEMGPLHGPGRVLSRMDTRVPPRIFVRYACKVNKAQVMRRIPGCRCKCKNPRVHSVFVHILRFPREHIFLDVVKTANDMKPVVPNWLARSRPPDAADFG